MRAVVLAFATILMAGPVLSQTISPLTGSTGGTTAGAPAATTPNPATPTPRRPRQTLQQRFDAANTPHDGHLTQAQARGHMPMVARNFDAIDTAHKGYVTVDEVRAYARARRAARRVAAPQ